MNPAQWENREKQEFITVLDNLNRNINRLFENYKEKNIRGNE
jgi:hypothetical protein